MGQDLEGSREVRSREATERGQVRMTFLCARPHLRAMGSPRRRRQVCLHSAEHGRWERRLVPARLACHGPWMPTTEGTEATCHVSARPVCRKDPTAAAAPPWASSTGCWALGGLSMSWLSQVLTSKALAEASLLHVAQEGLCRQSPQPLGSWPRFCLLAESQPAADVLTCCLVTQLALAPCRQTLDSWSPPCTPSTVPGLLCAQRVQAPTESGSPGGQLRDPDGECGGVLSLGFSGAFLALGCLGGVGFRPRPLGWGRRDSQPLVGPAWTRGGKEEPPPHSPRPETWLVSSGVLGTLDVHLPSLRCGPGLAPGGTSCEPWA